MNKIQGIILQPLSKSKYSWADYDKSNDFLSYFQKKMRENIGDRFDVNYNTEAYSNYLLIPYSTATYQCFGFYPVLNGEKSGRSDLRWSLILDESKNKEFNEIVEQKKILEEALYFGDEFEQINQGNRSSFHYLLHKPSKKFINFILSIGNKKEVNIKKAHVSIGNRVDSKPEFHPSLTPNYFDKNEYLNKEETKIQNGENAEILVYESIKETIDRKVLTNELNKLFDSNKIGEIHSQIEELIQYSKNFDPYAPFDLLSTRGEEIVYIEVKSTTGNEILFSINEIIFAYNHINNYQIKVVKNENIYDFEIDELISEIYDLIITSQKYSFETIKFKVDFNDNKTNKTVEPISNPRTGY